MNGCRIRFIDKQTNPVDATTLIEKKPLPSKGNDVPLVIRSCVVSKAKRLYPAAALVFIESTLRVRMDQTEDQIALLAKSDVDQGLNCGCRYPGCTSRANLGHESISTYPLDSEIMIKENLIQQLYNTYTRPDIMSI